MPAWLKSAWTKIGKWYAGKSVAYDNSPDDTIIIIGHYRELHWTARVARALVAFYLRNWQWLWGTVLTVVGLWLAVLALR